MGPGYVLLCVPDECDQITEGTERRDEWMLLLLIMTRRRRRRRQDEMTGILFLAAGLSVSQQVSQSVSQSVIQSVGRVSVAQYPVVG